MNQITVHPEARGLKTRMKEIAKRASEKDPVDRPMNRAERREYVRGISHRATRLAYGFGAWRRAAPGHFIKPARPRSARAAR